jgi:hypothetical protein
MIDISYLKVGVRGSIISDVVNVARLHSRCGGTNAGWFAIPREVFCLVDFLGSIAYNNIAQKGEDGASTRKAVLFVKEFFPAPYRPYANLLIAMWRHGTVHHFTPFVYYVTEDDKKVVVQWSSNRSDAKHNRAVNMRTVRKEACGGVTCLCINTCQLAEDLLGAFDKFVEKMEHDCSFKDDCLRRLKDALRKRNCMTLPKVGKAEKNEIRKQILLARASTEGTMRTGGQVDWDGK